MLALFLLMLMAEGEPPAAPTPPPTRCIVHFDGQHRVCGELVGRDEDAVRITDETGTQHSIPLPRVVAIEPLLELPVPTEGIVELVDGRQFRGLLKRDDCDAVEIMLHGAPIELDRHTVMRVWILAPLKERYAELKRSMPLERPRAHLALCRWLVHEKAWDLAIPELEAHTKTHRSAEAITLLRAARAQKKLSQSQAEAQRAKPDANPTSDPDVPEPVDDAAVNLIRVYELDLSNPPPIRIDEKTRQDFLDAYRTSMLLPQTEDGRQALLDGEPVELLKLMFAHRAREFYGKVQVLKDPEPLRRFRQSVHDLWLVPKCGSTSCHGGADAGRLRLLKRHPINDRIRTSNLLILDALTLDGHPMIDWVDPLQSTLIQYALPLEHATRPHPPVAGWRPALVSPQSRTTQGTVQWIESMVRSPRPTYPVEPPIKAPAETADTPRVPR
jgi:hypothetical protein